jgi:hypothetical protein
VKTKHQILSLLLIGSLAASNALAQTPPDHHGWLGTETIKTRFGEFEFKGGYPTPESATALLDQLKFNRAVEVYLTQLPAVAIIESRRGGGQLRREEVQPIHHLGTAHGRQNARPHGQYRDRIWYGFSRSES